MVFFSFCHRRGGSTTPRLVLVRLCDILFDPTDLVERTGRVDLAEAVEFGLDVVFELYERGLPLFVSIAVEFLRLL